MSMSRPLCLSVNPQNERNQNYENEMMETNQTGFLALQDFDLADVMCAEMDGLSAAFERVKIPSGGGVMFEIPVRIRRNRTR